MGRGFRGTHRAAESGSRVWPGREHLCPSGPREDEGQHWGAGRWAQRCFKAGRMEMRGVDGERERGAAARGGASERSKSFLLRGTNLSLFLPALGVTKEGKRTVAFLITHGVQRGE